MEKILKIPKLPTTIETELEFQEFQKYLIATTAKLYNVPVSMLEERVGRGKNIMGIILVKMDITYNELVPYLPYKLRIKRGERNLVMNNGSGSSTSWVGMRSVLSWLNSDMESKPYPVLRSLTTMSEEFTYQGRTVNLQQVLDGYTTKNQDGSLSLLIEGYYTSDVLKWPYYMVQLLLEYHFDIFSLIGRGLAIDIRTVSQEWLLRTKKT